MSKPIKALGMLLYAAMAVLAAIDPFWRQTKSAAPDYEEFNYCSGSSTECSYSVKTVFRKGTVEACKFIQDVVADLKVDITGRQGEPLILGRNCYVDESREFSITTRELFLTMAIVENPINSITSSEVSNESTTNPTNLNVTTNPTDVFYEQSQLKDCLA